MRRAGLWLLVLVLVSGLALASEPRLIFEETFDTPGSGLKWDSLVGDWDDDRGTFINLDQSNGNTNALIELEQFGTRFIYEYKVTFEDSIFEWGPAAGLHFLSDDGFAPQRGNSYLVFQDFKQVQFYKCTNGGIQLVASVEMEAYIGDTFTYRVEIDLETGKVDIYRDGRLVLQWVDSRPLEFGDFISVRTNKTMAAYDYIRVWQAD